MPCYYCIYSAVATFLPRLRHACHIMQLYNDLFVAVQSGQQLRVCLYVRILRVRMGNDGREARGEPAASPER